MSRLSFRPRPLDIHKKLPILKSIKDFEDDEVPAAATSTRNSYLLRLAAEADNEVPHNSSIKRSAPEIPTPQFDAVDTYEQDYSPTFMQPTSYLRGRGARAEIGEFVDYDLDDEDEDWLLEFNNEKKILAPEKFETILFKLEVLDHKIRERAGVITPTFGAPVPVLLELYVFEALQVQSVRSEVLESVYNYWKAKRVRWQKPILRHLQPPPPVNDTNPYNVFRPREKAHRLHTRRMQRRENNVQSFEKLRQVRRNLDQAKTVLESLIKREEKKREVMENEVGLQRIQLKYKDEAQLVEDGLAFPGFPSNSYRYDSSDDDFTDLDDCAQSSKMLHSPYTDSRLIVVATGRMKRRPRPHRWIHIIGRQSRHEPVLLFTKPLDPERLRAAGIMWPKDPPIENDSATPYRIRGRTGRGGRLIFDRWKLLLHAPTGHEGSLCMPSSHMPPQPND